MKAYYLYMIGVDSVGPIKIGVSSNPLSRLRSLQTGFHLDLGLLKKWQLNLKSLHRTESIVHDSLKDYRLKGEWFSCSPTIAIEAIETVLKNTKRGRDFSLYDYEIPQNEIKSSSAQIGGRISADIRMAQSRTKCDKIAARWPISNRQWPTRALLKEADLSYNTAIKFLGKRPQAQFNYQLAQKRKERRNAKR